jgi:hypothetical protein
VVNALTATSQLPRRRALAARAVAEQVRYRTDLRANSRDTPSAVKVLQ